MKSTVFVLCLLCATAAFGQSVGATALSAQPVVVQFYSHPEHASPLPMAQEQSLLIPSAYTYAKGERPLWEFAPDSYATPLGDTARQLKKEHAAAKKSDTVWVNF
jgi:hypothetical protein